MLLIVNVHRDGYHLDCWFSGGEHYIVEPPEHPYFYDRRRVSGVKCVPMRCRLLSSLQQVDLFKVECPNVYSVRRVRSPSSLEADVRFVERLCIDYGFRQDDTDCTVLAFDVEASSSSGQFPDPARDRVTAISVYSRRVQDCFVGDERQILCRFVDAVRRVDPDVIATFSGTAFDYVFTLQRARRVGVRLALGRLNDEPYTQVRTFGDQREFVTFLDGRICMDVYQEARFDATLSGVRKSLKSVGRHFYGEREVVEVDRSRMHLLSEDDLWDYCFSDARLTFFLAEHYLAVLKQLAVMLNVPLNFVVHRKPSHVGNVVYGRAFRRLGVVSDGANFERLKGVLFDER